MEDPVKKALLEENSKCHKCGKPAFKTDGYGMSWCEKCLNKAIHGGPVRVIKQRRNDPCRCGSGKKYKRCCLNK